ncbi:MAG: class I SAM-dependent methyltransferase [Azospirillaceae bacterium]|nr:class I SAM-dependent methyltransferase [Azospirillaceae bacterium]
MHDITTNVTLYDEAFYASQAPGSARSAAIILGHLFQWLQPRRVADVGCGVATWLRIAQALGASEVAGFDGDYVDRATLQIAPDAFYPTALDRELPRDKLPPGSAPFDLVISMEVVEHLPHDRGEAFITGLTQLGDTILFGAAIPFQGGTGHINELWAEYWAVHFRAKGYLCFDALRPLIWQQEGVDWWYAQNSLIFARPDSVAARVLPRESLRENGPLSFVHPKSFLTQVLYNFRTHRAAARGVEERDYDAGVQAWRSGASRPPQLTAPMMAEEAPHGSIAVFPATRMEQHEPEALAATKEAALQAALAETRALAHELAAMRHRALIAEAKVAALESSSSWRITAPIRKIASVLKNRSH